MPEEIDPDDFVDGEDGLIFDGIPVPLAIGDQAAGRSVVVADSR